MKRIGEMIKIKPEGKQAYIDWHANPLPGVNEITCSLTTNMWVTILKQIWPKWLRILQHKSGGTS